MAFTRQLTAEPDTISDADLAALRSHWNDYEIAEIVFHITNAAFFNRVTEAFQLPSDPTNR